MFQRFPYAAPRFCVKACGKLVQKHQLRLWNQRQHDKKPLAFAARQTFDRRVCLVSDAELRTQFTPVGGAAVKAGRFRTKLGNLDLFVIVALLKLYADTLEKCAAAPRWVLSQQADRSTIGLLCAEHEAKMRAKRNTVKGIIQRLNEEADAARRYLDICELEVLEPRYTDDFVLKLLYELINKGTSLRVKLPEGVFDMTTEVHGVYGE